MAPASTGSSQPAVSITDTTAFTVPAWPGRRVSSRAWRLIQNRSMNSPIANAAIAAVIALGATTTQLYATASSVASTPIRPGQRRSDA
jgi:hypothetical protein